MKAAVILSCDAELLSDDLLHRALKLYPPHRIFHLRDIALDDLVLLGPESLVRLLLLDLACLFDLKLRDLPLLGDLLKLFVGGAERLLLPEQPLLTISRETRGVLVAANVGKFPLVDRERLLDLRT